MQAVGCLAIMQPIQFVVKEKRMKRFIRVALPALLLVVSLAPPPSMADSRLHKLSLKLCKQKYKDAVRGAKYLRGRQRKERIEQAKQDKKECERHAAI